MCANSSIGVQSCALCKCCSKVVLERFLPWDPAGGICNVCLRDHGGRGRVGAPKEHASRSGEPLWCAYDLQDRNRYWVGGCPSIERKRGEGGGEPMKGQHSGEYICLAQGCPGSNLWHCRESPSTPRVGTPENWASCWLSSGIGPSYCSIPLLPTPGGGAGSLLHPDMHLPTAHHPLHSSVPITGLSLQILG